MMKLSLMQRVMNTVDEQWRSKFAEDLLNAWGYEEGTVFFYRSSANSLFTFKQNGKDYFLRCIDSTERNIHAIESEINILEYLCEKGLNVVKPVKSRNNKIIEVIETDLGVYHAVVFEKLPGEHLEMDELTDEQFMIWGASLGRLHKATKKLTKDQINKRSSWEEHFTWIKEHLPTHELSATQELGELEKWVKDLQFSEDDIGLIHYDFELDNLRWSDRSFSILDFDDAAVYWYVADIAYALRDLFDEDVDLDNSKFQAFIKGYKQENTMNESLLVELSGFLRIHNLLLFTKLLKVVDVPESDSNPHGLQGLRQKLINILNRHRGRFDRLAKEG
ncbi:MAG TPA: phosphotransferase [Paenibacillus sp.]